MDLCLIEKYQQKYYNMAEFVTDRKISISQKKDHYFLTSHRYDGWIKNQIMLPYIKFKPMGAEPPKPQKKVTIEDSIIEMKIQSKAIMRASKKAEKESQKYKKQAKDALKKNNEDFAKLYITSASQKRTEALNYQRTAIKMELMCDQVKSMQNNQKMINTFNYMTGMVSQQMSQIDTAKMSQNMQLFNDKMDEVLINNKMMNQMMQGSENVDTNVDHMMDALKQQIAVQDNTKIIEGAQKQQQYNYNPTQIQSQKQQQGHDPFLDQLKGL